MTGQGITVLKLKEGDFRLEIKKKFFTMWMVKLWNRLPGEVVEAQSRKCSMSGCMGL